MDKSSPFSPHKNPEFWFKIARQALSLLRNRDRPVLIGEVSLWISMNLKQTEILLTELLAKGLVKLADDSQLSSRSQSGHAYVLVNPQLIPMGDYEQVPIAILGAPPGA